MQDSRRAISTAAMNETPWTEMLTGMTSRAQGLAYLDADSTGGSCQPRLIQIQPALPKFRLRPRHGHHGLIEHSDGLQWLGVTKRAVCSALAGRQLCPKNRHWQRPAQPSGSSSCLNLQIARDFCMFGPGTGLPPGGPSGCRGALQGAGDGHVYRCIQPDFARQHGFGGQTAAMTSPTPSRIRASLGAMAERALRPCVAPVRRLSAFGEPLANRRRIWLPRAR